MFKHIQKLRAPPDTDSLPRPSQSPRAARGSTRCCRGSEAAWTSCLRWKFSGRWWGSDSRTVGSRRRLGSLCWSRCSADGWILLENVKCKVLYCLRWSEDWRIYLCLTRRLPRGMLRLDWWWSWSSGGRERSTSGWEWLREKRGSLEDKTRVIIRNRACSSIAWIFSRYKSRKKRKSMVGLVGIDLVVAYIAMWSDLTHCYCLTFRHFTSHLEQRPTTNHPGLLIRQSGLHYCSIF